MPIVPFIEFQQNPPHKIVTDDNVQFTVNVGFYNNAQSDDVDV